MAADNNMFLAGNSLHRAIIMAINFHPINPIFLALTFIAPVDIYRSKPRLTHNIVGKITYDF